MMMMMMTTMTMTMTMTMMMMMIMMMMIDDALPVVAAVPCKAQAFAVLQYLCDQTPFCEIYCDCVPNRKWFTKKHGIICEMKIPTKTILLMV